LPITTNVASSNPDQGRLVTTLCDKVCQWLASGRWYSPGTPVSSDERLSFEEHSNDTLLELDQKVMDKIWVPDTYFANEKRGLFHHITVPNKMMHLFRNGTVYYSLRYDINMWSLSNHFGILYILVGVIVVVIIYMFNSSTTGVTSRAGSAYPSGAPGFFVVFCRSLFVPLSFFCLKLI
jgi:hypothetical protein